MTLPPSLARLARGTRRCWPLRQLQVPALGDQQRASWSRGPAVLSRGDGEKMGRFSMEMGHLMDTYGTLMNI